MNESDPQGPAGEAEEAIARRRLELARQAFKDFHAQCFWSYRPDAEITLADLPWVIRELRHYGGHRGYRVVEELCR